MVVAVEEDLAAAGAKAVKAGGGRATVAVAMEAVPAAVVGSAELSAVRAGSAGPAATLVVEEMEKEVVAGGEADVAGSLEGTAGTEETSETEVGKAEMAATAAVLEERGIQVGSAVGAMGTRLCRRLRSRL